VSDELVLTPAERALLRALDDLGVRYLVVGMGAAILEGAPGTTLDIDLWFPPSAFDKLPEAARRAGGFYLPGIQQHPPTLGGKGLDRVDLVGTAHGLDSFEAEYERAHEYNIDGVQARVLPLERVIASKTAANRPKDIAQLPHLKAALAAREATQGRESPTAAPPKRDKHDR
jgi:hypothetical protein